MQCPKCHAMMHTYNRNGVQIEQCSGCRGIFLDYGELEALTRLESQYTSQQYGQVPPPAAPPAPYPPQHVAPAPAWGAPHQGGHHGHHHRGGFGRMLFSS
ncbi:zf-TFIIB domain-containing protein [Streptomyces sp. NPDC091371]|uniref:TFIIB-type zinc ribbon-containing protein n=1 Tax=Streptomyces sp. NPDC091371 TaxID=3155303 RepID=UPI00341E3481